MEELTARGGKREAAPEAPILLAPKSRLAKEELTARAWKREVAPEAPILLAP